MRKNIHKNFIQTLPSKLLYTLFGGVLLVSCGTQVGGYSETDGVYYDPETDVLPEQVVVESETENKVGDYYDYEKSGDIIRKGEENLKEKENRYSKWSSKSKSTEWGEYNGTEVHYNDAWDWNYGWGLNNPYWGSNFGYSFGWGSPWAWNGYAYRPFWNYSYYGGWSSFGFDPYWGYYSPYSFGYNPYYYGGGYYYNGFNNGFYGNTYYAPRYKYRRSGANGRHYGGFTNKKGYTANTKSNTGRYRSVNSGFRKSHKGFRNLNTNNRNKGYRNPNTNNRNKSFRSRTRYRNNTPRATTPNRTYRSRPSRSYNSNTRSRGFNRSSSSSRRSSGMRSGRSGGFRSRR